jgi:Family of unknown function (DUF6230)
VTEVVGQGTGRTKWKRFGLVLAPAVAAGAALVIMVANGVLAVSFAVSGTQFKVSADRLTGDGFSQYGSIDHGTSSTDLHAVVVSVIDDNAELTKLCQSVVVPIPGPLQPILGARKIIKITAGGGGTPATADNLVVDMTQLDATQARFGNMRIGQDASTLGVNSIVEPDPTAGGFGQAADSVDIRNLQQTAWATTAGTFTLPGLSLGFSSTECF